ncbi:Fe-S cluster assembly protein SufB [Candidatus Berkelbacteria bacterium]|nr:Fe-S cluster assembly protein SufB [Candidatus Berkelbacteria bacterium]
MVSKTLNLALGYKEKYGFSTRHIPYLEAPTGLNESVIRFLSHTKREPIWMLTRRLQALKVFWSKPLPTWGADLSRLDFSQITYYIKSTEDQYRRWEDVPPEITQTFERLGVPQAERAFLAGVGAQFESEVVYQHLEADLASKGVIFTDMDSALQQYPKFVKRYLGTVVSLADNKFAALNSAVWSGGSFVYVPAGVEIDVPLQTYFRINAKNMGQFERTLIIAEEGARVHYVEGCTAPVYASDSLHAAVVEVIAKPGAQVRYTTIQNWSNNVYNLVTKRAIAYQDAKVEWIDGNIGSGVTMKYPCVVLVGERAQAQILSLAYAGKNQCQDTGGKVIHGAPNTSSTVVSKSISRDGGRATYRGLVKVAHQATNTKVSVNCDALLLDNISHSITLPDMQIMNDDVAIAHEASVGRVSQDQLFYLQSRGVPQAQALALIIHGFIEPITRSLPFEYAIELNRLIELEMEGSVG